MSRRAAKGGGNGEKGGGDEGRNGLSRRSSPHWRPRLIQSWRARTERRRPSSRRARKLICRVPPEYQGHELQVFVDVTQHIPRDEVVSHVDSRILHCADRLAALFPNSSAPDKPTPFDKRIGEAVAEEAEKEEEWEKAKEERFERAVDVDSLTGSGFVMLKGSQGSVTIWTGRGIRSCPPRDRQHVDAAMLAAQASQERLDRAEEAFSRARAARNELEHARSRWRAVASVAK